MTKMLVEDELYFKIFNESQLSTEKLNTLIQMFKMQLKLLQGNEIFIFMLVYYHFRLKHIHTIQLNHEPIQTEKIRVAKNHFSFIIILLLNSLFI